MCNATQWNHLNQACCLTQVFRDMRAGNCSRTFRGIVRGGNFDSGDQYRWTDGVHAPVIHDHPKWLAWIYEYGAPRGKAGSAI